MNLLMISGDTTLAMDKEGVIGDTKERHVLYGKYLSQLFIVVLTKKEQNLRVKKLSENVIVYPTSSRKFFPVWDAYEIGKKICRENKIDVITVQGPFLPAIVGYMLKRHLGIPLNAQLHGGECLDNAFWLKESALNHVYNTIGKFIVKRADTVRAISQKLVSYLESDLKIPPERIINFPISIELAPFLKKGQTSTLGTKFSTCDNIILFVGKLHNQKNPALLLKAAPIILKRFPSSLFIIVGDGPERTELEKLTKSLNVAKNVKFEGRIANELLPAYYQACTVFAFPSNYEGWGRVAIEALACGKPVVMTDVGCAGEAVVDGETGYVVPAGSEEALAEKIIYLIENPQARQKMGEAGREWAQKTQNREKDGEKWLELCNKTVALARRRRVA